MDLLREAENNTPNKPPSLKVKLAALFSNIRGFNLLLLISAQFLAAIFIFSEGIPWYYVLKDINLWIIVFSTICVVSAGYIINNFYDFEADLINRPYKTSLENQIEQRTKLRLYFLLNFAGFATAFLISWKAALFFAFYIFLIWLYSHKLKSMPILGFVSVAILQLLPFFVIFVYYGNFSTIIFAHASFLFFLILMKELVKGLENQAGDEIQDRNSLSIVYGDRFSKLLYSLLTLLILNPVYYLLKFEPVGKMTYYFYGSYLILIFSNILLYRANSKASFLLVHNILRVLLFIGVFSIILIRY